MKNKIKKVIIPVIAMLVMSPIPSAAQTASYYFALEEGQYQIKADASKADNEQNYYVTQTDSAVPTGEKPRTRYYSYYNGNRVSKPLNLRCDDFNRHFEAYTINAPAGGGYQLFGEYVSGTGSRTSVIWGRWTP